jgi:hypothetical protein
MTWPFKGPRHRDRVRHHRAGNSYGTHENYVMDRNVPFNRIVARATPHLVTRQVFCGAGKVGSELPGRKDVTYQLSQRADFFEEEVGLETTLKRPIINTRDEPHADPRRYRRLHVIIGDANMSEWATWMKLATTSIVLAMIEDDWPMGELRPVTPVATLRHISWDLSLSETYETLDGRTITALGAQRELCALARGWGEQCDTSAVGGDDVLAEVLGEWERVLDDLEHDRQRAADRVDWVAKGRLLGGFAERHQLPPGAPKLRALDLQYHDMRPDRCLALRAGPAHAGERRGGGRRRRPAAHRHQGVVPGHCARAVHRSGGDGQLGFDRVRHRYVIAVAGADDGAHPRHRSDPGRDGGVERRRSRAVGQVERFELTQFRAGSRCCSS